MYILRLFCLLIIKVVYVASVITPLPSWIQVDDATCLKVQKASIRNAFNEMVDIASAASYRTMAWAMGQSQPPFDVVPRTIFTYFIAGHTQDYQNTVATLIGYLNDIKNLASNSIQTILISCGDSYLENSDVDKYGNQLLPGQTQLVDKRFTPWDWFPLNELGCRDGNTAAYSDAAYNYIVICPAAFALYPVLSRVKPNEDISVTDPQTYISQIRPLGVALFHEFLHILHDNTMANDNEAYGSQDCWRMALLNTPAAMTMPDCISLYAFSLYLEGNDWSSGMPKPA